MKFDHFPIDSMIIDQQFNCRSPFTLHSVEQLAASMRQRQLMPVLLADDHLIAGFSRVRAAQYLKWERICAVHTDLSPQEARVVNMMENIERRQLSVFEEARAIKIAFPRTKPPAIADELNRTTDWVKLRLRLLRMSEPIQKAADSGRLTEGDLKRLQERLSESGRNELFRKMISEAEVTRKVKPVRSQQAIRDMMVEFAKADVTDLPLAVLYWAEGKLTDEELKERL